MVGYKQTDIGLIPKNWNLISYEKAFNFLSTASYSKAELIDDGEYKYIHYGVIHTKLKHFIDFHHFEPKSIRKEQLKSYSIIKEGDVIMADASEDYSGICKSVEVKNIDDIIAISGLHTFLLRDKNNNFCNGFKGYLDSNRMIKNQFDRLATGLKVYGVSKGNLKLVQIPLPPPKEQEAIAQVLSDTDALTTALEKRIAKKRLIKQGAMQKLLTPQDDWEVKKLGEVCDIKKGQLITSDTKVEGVIPVIAGGKKPAYFHNKSNRNGKQITVSGSGANAGFVSFHNYPIFASDCSTIGESKKYKIEYIYYLLMLFQEDIYNRQTGGAQPHIHPSDISPIEIPFPPIQEQTHIANILSDMDNEIDALEKKLSKTKELKQGLMQQLLTGKIRLV